MALSGRAMPIAQKRVFSLFKVWLVLVFWLLACLHQTHSNDFRQFLMARGSTPFYKIHTAIHPPMLYLGYVGLSPALPCGCRPNNRRG